MERITLREIIKESLGLHYLTDQLKDSDKDNAKNYEKTIEREQNKFKKILKAYSVEPNLFKIGRQYSFPIRSKELVSDVLNFNLKKTPIHKLCKEELKQDGNC